MESSSYCTLFGHCCCNINSLIHLQWSSLGFYDLIVLINLLDAQKIYFCIFMLFILIDSRIFVYLGPSERGMKLGEGLDV